MLLNTQANNLSGPVAFAGTLANVRDFGLRNTNAGATVPTLSTLTKGPLGLVFAACGLLVCVWERASGMPAPLRGSHELGVALFIALTDGFSQFDEMAAFRYDHLVFQLSDFTNDHESIEKSFGVVKSIAEKQPATVPPAMMVDAEALTASIGAAKPMPTFASTVPAAIWSLIPITVFVATSMSGPPELPWLIAASV